MKDPKKSREGKGGVIPKIVPVVTIAPGPAAAKPVPFRAGKDDPRRGPTPTAPSSVSAGALKTLAAVRDSAVAEPKPAAKPAPARAEPVKTQPQVAKPGSDLSAKPSDVKPGTPKPVDLKPAPPSPPPKPVDIKAPSPVSKPAPLRAVEAVTPKPVEAPRAATTVSGPAPSSDKANGVKSLPPVPSSPNGPTPISAEPPSGWTDTAGWAELNGKMLDLMRSQTEANFAIWRSTLAAGSLSEAIRMQTTGVREAYEATAAQWRDIAETAARLMSGAKPMQLPWLSQDR